MERKSKRQQNGGRPKFQPKTEASKQQKRLLYVDIWGFKQKICNSENYWDLESAKRNVEEFHDAALNAGWVVTIFINANNGTEEISDRWKKSREDQVKGGTINFAPNLSRMLGELFQEVGATVHFTSADCTDTLVSMAQKDKAAVLAKYKDFFGYKGAKYYIYNNFKYQYEQQPGEAYQRKVISLIPAKPPARDEWISRKQLLDPIPFTYDYYPNAEIIMSTTPISYIRGCPSNLVREVGNLHILLKPLRAAFYYMIGVQPQDCESGGVKESFPFWDDEKQACQWTNDFVAPDPALMGLLLEGKPIIPAFKHYYKQLKRPDHIDEDSINWQNHLFGLASLIAELKSCAYHKISTDSRYEGEDSTLGGVGAIADGPSLKSKVKPLSMVKMILQAKQLLTKEGIIGQKVQEDKYGLVESFQMKLIV
ncbi:hypothetical protein FGO68_gene9480 [Halteria grandinella]|uniref:Uncharacterized protein n=1 Tax=Halteria grandinella TaxID=5974 RepID=A0A8J8NNC3_HALGN|nr:hypothetical protein FGO68_gene9480 [Halteria grandinella]